MNLKKTTVSVEDLLRLKRAERPPAEFWNEFDRELRLKQLAAIIEPRPWFAPFIRVSARISHYQLPLGAAAILALSLVTVTEYRSANLNPDSGAEVALPIMTAQLPVQTRRMGPGVRRGSRRHDRYGANLIPTGIFLC